MEILTWTSPRYFKFCNALIRSIRYFKNYNIIHLGLLDFSQEQVNSIKDIYSNDSKIKYYYINKKDYEDKNNINIKNSVSFYQNFRPDFFLDVLNTNNGKNICTFGANGIVFSNLNYIEEYLVNNNFVFLERKKKNIFLSDKPYVSSINDIQKLVEDNININDILKSTTGKVVLLGTHGIKNNSISKEILQKWSNLIKENDNINKQFSDMNFFVKAVINYQIENNVKIKNYTANKLLRKENDLCDTSLLDGNKIWFAKGNLKWNSKKYIDKVNFFCEWKDYKI